MSAAVETVPTCGNTRPSMGMAVRRLVLLDLATRALGGAAKVGTVLGIGRRAVNHKLSADRRMTDIEMLTVADAVEAQAAALMRLAADIRGMVGDA